MNPKLHERLEARGLERSTQEKYAEILEGAPTDDLITWIHAKVQSRTSIGTVLPLRAAVKHYLIGVMGYSVDEVESLLPAATGRPSHVRQALTDNQLARYLAAVEQLNSAPARALLGLLPATGLSIGEATGLRVEHIQPDVEGQPATLVFQRRDRMRVISLPSGGRRLVTSYLNAVRPTGWLFQGNLGNPLTPHAVRKHTRAIADKYQDLAGLSPQVLRATYAALMLRKGKSLSEVQALMGHESILSTQRYLGQV